LSFRFLSRRLASATRFLLFRSSPECKLEPNGLGSS